MKFMLRLLCASALIMMLGFCVFGFVATFEPMPSWHRMVWRTAYAMVAIASLFGLFPLLRSLVRCFKTPRS